MSGHAGILIVPQVPIQRLAAILEPLADTGEPLADRVLAWTEAKRWHVPGG